MSIVRERLSGMPAGVAVTDTPDGLSAIHRTESAAALWRRQLLPGFRTWIEGLDPSLLPRARLILRPEAVRDAVGQVCEAAGTPPSLERDLLIDDVAALSEVFAGLMRAHWLQLRLDVVSTNACRKFHVDTVRARLICTYRGRGTEYGRSAEAADPCFVFCVPTGAPILLRGKLWAEYPRSGLLHRSPPIEGTGETRLVLVLDEADPPDALPG